MLASKRGGENAPHDNFVSGMVAGVVAGLVTYPLETLKTIVSVPKAVSGSFSQVVVNQIRNKGVGGLYRVSTADGWECR